MRQGGRRAPAAYLGALLAGAACAAPARAAEIDNARAYCAKENAHWVGGEQQCACNPGYSQSGNTCVSAGAGSSGSAGGGFAVPPGALNAAIGGAIGSALGNALVAPLANPYQGHVRPRPVVGDEDESAPNPEVSDGVGDAQDIIGGFTQSDRFSACLEDPLVFCGDRKLSDMSSLDANESVTADEELTDAVGEPAAPAPAAKKTADQDMGLLAKYWSKFTDAVSTEEIFRQITHLGGLLSGTALKGSEGIGSAATGVGIIDAGVAANNGENSKAVGMGTAVSVGVASEGTGFALAACGKIDPCAKTAATGFDAIASAPGNAAGAYLKTVPDQDLIMNYQYEHDGMTYEQAQQHFNQGIDANTNKLNNSGQNKDFVNGLTGASQ